MSWSCVSSEETKTKSSTKLSCLCSDWRAAPSRRMWAGFPAHRTICRQPMRSGNMPAAKPWTKSFILGWLISTETQGPPKLTTTFLLAEGGLLQNDFYQLEWSEWLRLKVTPAFVRQQKIFFTFKNWQTNILETVLTHCNTFVVSRSLCFLWKLKTLCSNLWFWCSSLQSSAVLLCCTTEEKIVSWGVD